MENDFEARLKGVVVRDGRYALQSYKFIYEGLDFTLNRLGCKRHITGRELCEGIRDLAIEQFGGLASMVLGLWGIRVTGDIGNMVYNLIEAKLMSRSDSDSREDFEAVYDFKDAFRFDAGSGALKARREA